jgi:hypothetical protein
MQQTLLVHVRSVHLELLPTLQIPKPVDSVLLDITKVSTANRNAFVAPKARGARCWVRSGTINATSVRTAPTAPLRAQLVRAIAQNAPMVRLVRKVQRRSRRVSPFALLVSGLQPDWFRVRIVLRERPQISRQIKRPKMPANRAAREPTPSRGRARALIAPLVGGLLKKAQLHVLHAVKARTVSQLAVLILTVASVAKLDTFSRRKVRSDVSSAQKANMALQSMLRIVNCAPPVHTTIKKARPNAKLVRQEHLLWPVLRFY